MGNPTGGRAQGTIYEGLTEVSVGIDLDKAIGLPGAIVNVSALQIHGRGLSTNNIDNLMTVSNIEADPSTDLYDLWYQQSFFGGKVDVKIGQQSADLEFMTTQYGGLFINSSFGWPALASLDLPSGRNSPMHSSRCPIELTQTLCWSQRRQTPNFPMHLTEGP